ncbi:ABC transporter permease [Pseudomarimonas arenosa]|uniref:Transport permease protein n=1 Tax=Pseudomarimonas arenosa TaxID=2774145 RepID=A0AAW3ZGD4_9GAMM|nr:ABC transporter permease [Pseudomarimonas arenosa]MBD8525076.1 ABC transporter permease [Pseudomarimonas arenosa]
MTSHWQSIRLFLRQDFNQRFADNAIGVAWALILPLAQLALFALLFIQIFKARVPGLEGVGYLAFLALGMWPWFAFAEAVERGSSALVDNAGLLGKVAVPLWHLILARILMAFALHGLGFALVLTVLWLDGAPLAWPWLALSLLAWPPLFLLACALATLFALLRVFVRDLAQITPFLLTALMFSSPILYAAEMLPEHVRGWLALNPLAVWIGAIRDPLLWDRGMHNLGVGLLGLALLSLLALFLYRRLRVHVEDFL